MYRIVEFDRFFRINDLILSTKKPSERIIQTTAEESGIANNLCISSKTNEV